MKNSLKKTHEQFLEDLWNKNKHYRDGKFKVVGQYECAHCKIGVVNHLNILLMPSAAYLLRGSPTSIKLSTNKSEYFVKMCYFKFGDDGINNLKEIEYVHSKKNIRVIDKDYGEYFITPNHYLRGGRHPKRGYNITSKKLRASKQSVENKIKALHPELEFVLCEYKSRVEYINVKNKYGICRVSIANLLAGYKPTISLAINKNEYFANQAREIHGDKYDYSLVEYKNSKTKVKIISKNGVFEQHPFKHLSGQVCPVEGKKIRSDCMRNNPTGWTYTNWEAAAKLSKNFTGYKVYIVECYNAEDEERFFKVGKTYVDVESRLYGKKAMPYTYSILKVIETTSAREACEIEQELKNKHKEFKYIPKIKFGGMYECFSSLNIDLQTN